MRILLTVVLFALCTPIFSAIGDIKSWTYLHTVTDMVNVGRSMYIATTGGLRITDIYTLNEKVINEPKRGMYDIRLMAVVARGQTVWAISEDGLLYQVEGDKLLRTFDRGLGNLGWKVSVRAALSFGNYIVFGTSKGLVFFDVTKSEIAFSLDRIDNIISPNITAIAMRDSVLTIATNKKVYEIKPYWASPANAPADYIQNNGGIYNPGSWKEVPNIKVDTVSADTVTHLTYMDSSWIASKGYFKLNKNRKILAISGEPLLIDSLTFKSHQDVKKIIETTTYTFLINQNTMYIAFDTTISPIGSPTTLWPGTIINLKYSPQGIYFWNFWEQSPVTHITAIQHDKWTSLPFKTVFAHGPEPLHHSLEMLQVGPDGTPYVASWGLGIVSWKDGIRDSIDQDNSCLKSPQGISDYTVLSSSTPLGNKGFFVAQFMKDDPYRLAYFDYATKEVTCYAEASQFKGGLIMDMKVDGDSLLLITFDKGVDAYRINNLRSELGLVKIGRTAVSSQSGSDGIATVMDNFGRLWLATDASLWYGDHFSDLASRWKSSLSDSVAIANIYRESGYFDSLKEVNNLTAEGCAYSLKDTRGHLWWSCRNGLFEIIPGKETPIQEFNRYTNNNGLLSTAVGSISYDSSTGDLWIVSRNGVNVLSTGSRDQTISKSNTPKVYPNPFRPIHDKVIFDNLSSNATVTIFTESGYVVIKARPTEILGWQWHWDGKNNHGNKVSPGIYYYAIESDGETTKGKLIVGR